MAWQLFTAFSPPSLDGGAVKEEPAAAEGGGEKPAAWDVSMLRLLLTPPQQSCMWLQVPPPLLPPGGDRSLIGARPQVTHDLVEFQAFRRRRCRRPRRRRPRTRTPPPPPPHPTVAAVRGGGRGRRRCARGCRPTSTRSSACPSARCGAAAGPPPAPRRHTQCLMRDLPRPPKDLARWHHHSGDYSGVPYCKACRGPGPRTPGG